MQSTTIFTNGKSTQAVRIPKEFQFDTKEVWIEKKGESLVLTPKPNSWDDFFENQLKVSDDFSTDRDDSPPEERQGF